MTATKTKRTAKPAVDAPRNWDQSVLSITQEEMAEMDDEEKNERASEEIDRAIDLLEAVADAFGRRVQPTEIAEIVHVLKRISRSL